MKTEFTKEGKGDDVLLFLHGWGCDGSIFAPVIDLLKDDYVCVAPDLWGFGKSDLPPSDGWNAENYADALFDFVTENTLAHFSVVAHSFGARVAMVFAAKYGKFVDKLVLTGAAGLRKRSLKRTLKVVSYKISKFFVRCGIIGQQALANYGSVDYKALSGDAMKNTFVKIVGEDLGKYARQIQQPVLLLWGENDAETPLWMQEKLNKYIKYSWPVVISGTHFAFLENKKAFAAICRAFLGEK